MDDSRLSQSIVIETPEAPIVLKDSRVKGIIYVNLFALFITVLGACMKEISAQGVSVGEFQVSRCFLMFILVNFWNAFVSKKNPCSNKNLPKGQFWLVILRSILGFADFLLYNIALQMIPLALCIILFNLSPFWTSFLGWLVNNEPIFMHEYFAMAACLLCVVALTLASHPDRKTALEVQDGLSDKMQMATGILIMFVTSWVNSALSVVNRCL